MIDPELSASADRMLAALDFAGQSAQQSEQHRRQMASLLRGVIETLDSLQSLATHCRSLPAAGDPGGFPVKTIELIVKQLDREIQAAGATPMDAVGQPLDLERHEVVSVRHEPTCDDDTVLEETVHGYLWQDRVLRYAKVIVSRRTPADT
jgi:molecular chaperone GrpE